MPDWLKLRAFIAKPHQGINYNAGCWHVSVYYYDLFKVKFNSKISSSNISYK